MSKTNSLLLAAAVVALGATTAYADPNDHSSDNRNDQQMSDRQMSDQQTADRRMTDRQRSDRQMSDTDHTGYGNGYNYGYDDGYARRDRNDRYRSDVYHTRQSNYQRGAYYYGSDCESNNTAGGTIAGAIIGGVIGNQIGHGGGRTAATFGGVILGGIAGNAIASDMNCDDRRVAFSSYSQGFDGRIGHRYTWRGNDGGSYGSFTPVREYRRGGNVCRDFTAVSYRNGRDFNRRGTACRQSDGNWYMQ